MAHKIRIKRGSESKVKTLYENGVVPQGEPIYAVDTNHLFIGNGNNDKTALFSSKKEIVFVVPKLTPGVVKAEIPFPYNGQVLNITANTTQDVLLTEDLVADIEFFDTNINSNPGKAWQKISTITVLKGSNFANVDLTQSGVFDISKYGIFRVNIKDIQANTIDLSLTVIINIATVI